MDVILREPAISSTRDVVLWAPTDVAGVHGTAYDRTASVDVASVVSTSRRSMSLAREVDEQIGPEAHITREVSVVRLALQEPISNPPQARRVVDYDRRTAAVQAVTDSARRSFAAARTASQDHDVQADAQAAVAYPRSASDAVPGPADSASRTAAGRRTAGAAAQVDAVAARASSYVREVVQPTTLTPSASYSQTQAFLRNAMESVVEPVARGLRQITGARTSSDSAAVPVDTTTRVLDSTRSSSAQLEVLVTAARRAEVARTSVVGLISPVLEASFRVLSGRRAVVLRLLAHKRASVNTGTVEQI